MTLEEVLKQLALGSRTVRQEYNLHKLVSILPWGDLEDASLAKCRESRDEDPPPEPVDSFLTAMSVYGMGDAAGNVWDWTDSWFDERRSLRVLRGGAWGDASLVLRSAVRGRDVPADRGAAVGFRVARGPPPL